MAVIDILANESLLNYFISEAVGPYPHWHDNYELVFVEKGSMMFYFENDDEPVELEEGSILLIDPNVLHTPVSHQNTPYTIHVLSFRENALNSAQKDSALPDDSTTFRTAQIPAEMIPYISGIGKFMEGYSNSAGSKDVLILKQYMILLLSIIEKYDISLPKKSIARKISEKHHRIRLACMYIEQHPEENPRAEELAKIANYSSSHFFRLFREVAGCSVNEYVKRVKIREAQRLLRNENSSVTEVSYRLGFSHPNNFSRTYRRITGRSPRDEKRKE